MHARALALLALVSLTILPACVICVDHDHDHCDEPEEWSSPTPEVGNYSGAIRAARTISFSAERTSTLNTIATKPDLDEPSQLMLINSLRGSWGFSSDKAHVLETLASNPALTPRASLAIADHLAQIVSFSSDRKRIADLLANRPVPTPVSATGVSQPAK